MKSSQKSWKRTGFFRPLFCLLIFISIWQRQRIAHLIGFLCICNLLCPIISHNLGQAKLRKTIELRIRQLVQKRRLIGLTCTQVKQIPHGIYAAVGVNSFFPNSIILYARANAEGYILCKNTRIVFVQAKAIANPRIDRGLRYANGIRQDNHSVFIPSIAIEYDTYISCGLAACGESCFQL